MAEYVSKETLLKAIEKMDRLDKETNTQYEYDKEGYILLIKQAPTADVVEVKHGEWKDRYNNKYYNHLYECSVCGKEALYECYKNELDQWKERQALTPICPYCGAKMDKENTQ